MRFPRFPVYALLGTLAACASTPPQKDPNAAVQVKIVRGPVQMPPGVNLGRLNLVHEARLIRVYTQTVGVGDSANEKAFFPPSVAQKVELTNRQANRRFEDMILTTRRFQVFDDSTTVVRENAYQTLNGQPMDIIIDAQVVDATQDVIDLAPYRKVQTRIRLSVQMKDVLTGEELFPTGVSVVGEWGLTQGEGVMLAPNASLTNADIQLSLANDYKRALDKALTEAVLRIGKVLRPLGRVTVADTQTVNMLGGSRQGFQSGDVIVIFRAETAMFNGQAQISRTQPLAVARCNGVGTDQSECDLTRIDPRYPPPNKDDYTVLSEKSAEGIREQ